MSVKIAADMSRKIKFFLSSIVEHDFVSSGLSYILVTITTTEHAINENDRLNAMGRFGLGAVASVDWQLG